MPVQAHWIAGCLFTLFGVGSSFIRQSVCLLFLFGSQLDLDLSPLQEYYQPDITERQLAWRLTLTLGSKTVEVRKECRWLPVWNATDFPIRQSEATSESLVIMGTWYLYLGIQVPKALKL